MLTTAERASDDRENVESRPPVVPSWLPLTILSVGVGWLAIRASGPVTEMDTWWHLRLGDEFRAGWSLSDPGALTPFATEQWLPTQWLPEVASSILVERFGIVAVSWLVGIAVLVLGFALFTTCRQQASSLPAAVATLTALGGVSAMIAPRPQLLSFVLTAMFVGAWLATAADRRPRWWLVPLSWLWACSHGMWFVGVALGVSIVLGMALDRATERPVLLRLMSIPLLGGLAAALTPAGPGLVLAPLEVGGITGFITEWGPANFRDPYAMLTALTVTVVILAWARSQQSVPWVRVLLLVQALGWMLLSARTVALAAIIAAPLLAAVLSSWMAERLDSRRRRRDVRTTWILAALLIAAVSLIMPLRPTTASPVGAGVDEALAAVPSSAVVINEYALGGWLEWRHRHVVPVVDGLTESYSHEHLRQFTNAMASGPGWEEFVRETGATQALLYGTTPLAEKLRSEHGWTVTAAGMAVTGREVWVLQAPE